MGGRACRKRTRPPDDGDRWCRPDDSRPGDDGTIVMLPLGVIVGLVGIAILLCGVLAPPLLE